MENPIQLNTREEDHNDSAPDLRTQLAPRTNYDDSMDLDLRLRIWYDEDAPRNLFTASSASPKTSSLTDAHSLKKKTDSTDLARERTDSEKADNGEDEESQIDKGVDVGDEPYRRGQEVRTFPSDSFILGPMPGFRRHVSSAKGSFYSSDLFRKSSSWLKDATLTLDSA